MGQLERYGLYVLCLVIVLILGVAIWGGDQPSTPSSPNAASLLAEAGVGVEDGLEPLNSPPTSASVTTQDDQELDVIPVTSSDQGQGSTQMAFFSPNNDGADDMKGAVQPDDTELTPNPGPVDVQATPVTEHGPVEKAAMRTYTVKPGDSFDAIARRVLGSSNYTAEIQRMNPDVDPRKLQIGTVIKLPSIDESTSAPSSDLPNGWRSYTVKKGDSIWRISKVMYGDPSGMDKIVAANGMADRDELAPGTVLKIPPIE